MPNKMFLVRLRTNAFQEVRAATVEVHGEHLAFLTDKGKLAALFLLDVVESWNEIGPARKASRLSGRVQLPREGATWLTLRLPRSGYQF